MAIGPKLAKKTGRLTNLFCDKGDFWRISDPFGLNPPLAGIVPPLRLSADVGGTMPASWRALCAITPLAARSGMAAAPSLNYSTAKTGGWVAPAHEPWLNTRVLRCAPTSSEESGKSADWEYGDVKSAISACKKPHRCYSVRLLLRALTASGTQYGLPERVITKLL